ncbi:hypothetical protein G173_gp222 [Erwinia phage phiEaH2]|uniref:Uncharacterized protein n=1 Tax=Erwinia phage phiEaH2 TaxID=1029988 RepID=J7KJQ2_9CAUD|nr:hypothetical protein G173_gp222 [Erwinia phage phiEaH2]AFQ96767.1 hypothetical protein [Erwinia phage phiEaH2]
MSEPLDQRPSNVRRPNLNQPEVSQDTQELVLPPAAQIQTMDSEDAVMLIKKSNPGFSFARAEQVYNEHYPVQPLQVEEPVLQRPVYQQEEPPAPPVAPTVAPETPKVPEETAHVTQPAGPDTTIFVEPKPEPKVTHQHVHQSAPVQKETTVDDKPFTPASPEKQVQHADHEKNAAPQVRPGDSERQVNFGKGVYQPETAELPEDDRDAVLTGLRRLVGPMQDPNLIGKDLQRFFSSVKRSPEDGRLLFESEEQQNRYGLIYAALNMTPPTLHSGVQAFDQALERADTPWEQRVLLPGFDKPAGLISPRNNMHTGPIAALRRRRKTGIPNSVWLPATGIYVGFKAPNEREFCDFDMQLTLETATIGMQTYGLMLSSSSGVYIRHMVEFALQFVTECTLDCEGNDMKTVLLDKIDLADYWLVILGPIQAKFPAGLPWTLICGRDGCEHEESVKLNIARCIRMGTGLYTDLQRNLWAHQRGTDDFLISQAEQAEFVNNHLKDPAAVFEKDGVTVTFGRCSIGEFFDHTESWMADINASTTTALSANGTEREKENHMRLTAETRRLTRYAHMVESISVVEEQEVDGELVQTTQTERDYKKIVVMLEELSPDRLYVSQFEEAMALYNERSRLAVFGYMGQKCSVCGGDHDGEKEGLYRGIVTISPDRVFFELSRVVSEIQKFLLRQYGVTG